MTELQQKLLQYFKEYHKTHRTNPTLTEAAQFFEVTRQTITTRADALVAKGYMTKLKTGVYLHTRKQ